MRDEPKVGQVWRHRSGALYRIVPQVEPAGKLRRIAPGPLCVYEALADGRRFARISDDWGAFTLEPDLNSDART